MYDRETNSLWSQGTGEAISGALKGKRLTMLASMPQVRWDTWRRLHCHTMALSVHGQQDCVFDRYEDYAHDETRIGFFPAEMTDRRARPKEKVLGVVDGIHSAAYRFVDLKRKPLVTDRVGSRLTLIYYDVLSGATAVYALPGGSSQTDFRLEGIHILRIRGHQEDCWKAATGASVRGGPNLKPLPHTTAYWFAWTAFHPGSRLYSE